MFGFGFQFKDGAELDYQTSNTNYYNHIISTNSRILGFKANFGLTSNLVGDKHYQTEHIDYGRYVEVLQQLFFIVDGDCSYSSITVPTNLEDSYVIELGTQWYQ